MIGAIIAGVEEGSSLVSSLTGNSAEDAARKARVAYFVNLAVQGNVGAMQVLLGSPQYVSGNEKPIWTQGQATVQAQNPAVYAAALAAGPVAFPGTGDTPENYPSEKNYALQWAASHAHVGTTTGPGAAPANPLVPAQPQPGSVQTLPGMRTVAPAPTSATGLATIAVMLLVVVLLWLFLHKVL